MNLMYITVILATVACNVRAKFIPINKKINSQMLTMSDLEGYMSRISPKSKLNYNTFDNESKRRVTRDTLLNLYRQKQLYNNLNRNLYESYFQTPISENEYSNSDPSSRRKLMNSAARQQESRRLGKNSNSNFNTFKKLNLNPYKEIYQNTNEYKNNLRKKGNIYKKHSGFKVTDSVNHLKYLVSDGTVPSIGNQGNQMVNMIQRPEQSTNPESQPIQDLDITSSSTSSGNPGDNKAELIRKIIGSSSNGSDNNLDFSRQRRGEFAHNRLSQMDQKAKMELLGLDSLRK